MSIVLRAFPIRAKEQLQSFVDSLNGERKQEADSFYRAYNVSHESWHIQDTPAGPWVICLTIVANPTEVAARYAKSNVEFDSWFKSQWQRGMTCSFQSVAEAEQSPFAL